VDQKFTGQVRDTETLNDFFNAHYYTAPLMRFLSSDPGNAGADPTGAL
jgi:RHS repeat-associated protein